MEASADAAQRILGEVAQQSAQRREIAARALEPPQGAFVPQVDLGRGAPPVSPATPARPDPADVLALADAVAAQVRAVKERLETLTGLVDEALRLAGTRSQAAPPPPPAPPGPEPPTPEQRMAAVEMAVMGLTRAQSSERLRGEHGLADPGALLDDVFGEGAADDATVASARAAALSRRPGTPPQR